MGEEGEVTVVAPTALETRVEDTIVVPTLVMVVVLRDSVWTEEGEVSPGDGEVVVGEAGDVVGGVELSPGEVVGDVTGEDVVGDVGAEDELSGDDELPGEEVGDEVVD